MKDAYEGGRMRQNHHGQHDDEFDEEWDRSLSSDGGKEMQKVGERVPPI